MVRDAQLQSMRERARPSIWRRPQHGSVQVPPNDSGSRVPTQEERIGAVELGIHLALLRSSMTQAWLTVGQHLSDQVVGVLDQIAFDVHNLGLTLAEVDRLLRHIQELRNAWEEGFGAEHHCEALHDENSTLATAPGLLDSHVLEACKWLTWWIRRRISALQETIESELSPELVEAERLGTFVADLAYPTDPYVEMLRLSEARRLGESTAQTWPTSLTDAPAQSGPEWLLPDQPIESTNRQPSATWRSQVQRRCELAGFQLINEQLDDVLGAENAETRCRLLREALERLPDDSHPTVTGIEAPLGGNVRTSAERLGLRIDLAQRRLRRDGSPDLVRLPELRWRLFSHLLQRGADWTSLDELVSMWAEFGGSRNPPRGRIDDAISELNRQLAPLRLLVANNRRIGWRIEPA